VVDMSNTFSVLKPQEAGLKSKPKKSRQGCSSGMVASDVSMI